MTISKRHCLFIVFLLSWSDVISALETTGILKPPQLITLDNRTYLSVQNKPYTILGGELSNSAASHKNSLTALWPRLKSLNLNTVLVPVYWELLEPKDNEFDFSLIDQAIMEARQQNMKLIFLWFGTWKNSMSSYVPAWIKLNAQSYPRVKNQQGQSQDILSPFYARNREADKQAYVELLRHIKKMDASSQTVIMIQVENEVGNLPSARDYSDNANTAFQAPVPTPFINYLKLHKNTLHPHVLTLWKAQGFPIEGNWETLFGKNKLTDELFMAWHLADYVNTIAEAGKHEYPLPTFVNAALNRPGWLPGDYPSGGPLPHVFDLWHAAAPSIDVLSPDFYNPDFTHWNDQYKAYNGVLLIPEIKYEPSVATKAILTFGHYQGIGFSPFSIDTPHPQADAALSQTYKLLNQIEHLLHLKSYGVLLNATESQKTVSLKNFSLKIKHDHSLQWTPESKQSHWADTAALIIPIAENEYWVLGTGVVITHESTQSGTTVGLLSVEQGEFEKGQWQVKRYLNGDETHQGRHVRIPFNEYQIQRVKLYTYQ